MKLNLTFLLLFLFTFTKLYSQEAADLGLTTFQLKEIEKKNKSANALIISGIVATALGGVMVGTWAAEDDSVIIVSASDSTDKDTVVKSPVRLISGAVLGATGLALEVGGIIQKIKARRMKEQFIENNKASQKVSFYIKPRGLKLVYRF